MNAPRCGEEDSIDFPIASPKSVSATEAARVQPAGFRAAAHDAFTRLLHRLEPDPAALWEEARPQVDPLGGVLVVETRRSTSRTPGTPGSSPRTGPASTRRSSAAST